MSGTHRQKDSRLVTLFMAITQNPREMISQLRLTSKILHRRFDRLPFAARCSLFTSFILCLLIYGSFFYILFGNQLKRDSFVEMHTCPACYGFRACEDIKEGEVWLTGWSKIRFLDYVNVHNNHYGKARGRTVLITKLGTNKEIAAMEAGMCALAREPKGCEAGAAAARALPASGSKWMQSHLAGKTDMTACPTERLMERIMDRYHEKLDAILLSARERAQLVTTLMINAEPILFQTFPASEGWPFPSYFGACGRFVIIDWPGDMRPLFEFYQSPWLTRARLAHDILRIGARMMDNPSRFALYWTEVDELTFTVNVTGHVMVTDGRHIVVADLWQMEQTKAKGWDQPHAAEFQKCPEGIDQCQVTVPRDDLCQSHSSSDQNFYVLCRGVLSSHARNGGLLHDIPRDVDDLYNLRDLTEKCARPDKPSLRAETSKRLIKALSDIVGPRRV